MPASVPYLGVPGSMVALPGLPTADLEAAPARGETATTLLSGGSAVTKRLNARRGWTLPYDYLDETGSDVLTGLYAGLYGDGPFVFVDPTVRNVLPLDTASCGARRAAWHGWTATSGQIQYSSAIVNAPDAAAASGVLKWTSDSGDGNGVLAPGAVGGSSPDLGAVNRVATCAVWLPQEHVTASLFVRSADGATVTLRLAGLDSAGQYVGAVGADFAVAGQWQRISVTARPYQPELAGSAYVLPRVRWVANSGSAGLRSVYGLRFAAAQLEYAASASPWQPGFGSPRVVLPAGPGRTVPLLGFATHSLVLAEV